MAEKEQLKVSDEWNKVNQWLDEYEKHIGLNLKPNDKVEELLNLNYDQLNSLSNRDLSISSYLLAQYSTWLQKEYNRHSAKRKWCYHCFDVMIGKFGRNMGGQFTPYDERKLILGVENSFCEALSRLIKETTSILETLSFMSKKIESMAFLLRDISRIKEDPND